MNAIKPYLQTGLVVILTLVVLKFAKPYLPAVVTNYLP